MAGDEELAPVEGQVVGQEWHRDGRRVGERAVPATLVQVHGAPGGGGDGDGGAVKHLDAVGKGGAGDDAGLLHVAGLVGGQLEVDDGAEGEAEKGFRARQERRPPRQEVVVVGDVELAAAGEGDGVGPVDERVLDGAGVRGHEAVQVEAEELDPGAGLGVVGSEQGRRLLVVCHAEGVEVGLAGKVDHLDASERAGVGRSGVLVVVDVETGTGWFGEKDALRVRLMRVRAGPGERGKSEAKARMRMPL